MMDIEERLKGGGSSTLPTLAPVAGLWAPCWSRPKVCLTVASCVVVDRMHDEDHPIGGADVG